MPSGKRSKQQRREAAVAGRTPPPVRSKSGGPRTRQASPKALAIGGGVAALVVVGIVLAIVLGGSGGGSGIPAGTPTVGSLTNALPGAADTQTLFKGIPQQGLTLGSAGAPVTMVMYIDLQCPICKEFETTAMPTIVQNYVRTGKVQVQLKPWQFIGPDSIRGQAATIAASFQNKAYNFAEVLYDNQGKENSGWLTDAMIAQIAASVPGMDVKKLFADRNSSAVKSLATNVDSSATASNVVGTPTVLVGKAGTTPKDVTAPGNAPTLQDVETAILTALGK